VICWCEEINHECVECEAKRKYNSLSHADKKLVDFFEKHSQVLSVRNNINKFEERHRCDWTDFVRFKNE
jgi:hypothetical protein